MVAALKVFFVKLVENLPFLCRQLNLSLATIPCHLHLRVLLLVLRLNDDFLAIHPFLLDTQPIFDIPSSIVLKGDGVGNSVGSVLLLQL